MTLTELKSKINRGSIDTVIVACPDLFGRLVGKRFTGKFFLDQVAKHGTHACSYLLTVDIEMEPQDGFKLANWEKGFGDFAMRPDFSTVMCKASGAMHTEPGRGTSPCFAMCTGRPVTSASQLSSFVPRPGTSWCGVGTAFKTGGCRLVGTVLARRAVPALLPHASIERVEKPLLCFTLRCADPARRARTGGAPRRS